MSAIELGRDVDEYRRWPSHAVTVPPAGPPEAEPSARLNAALTVCAAPLEALRSVDAVVNPTNTGLTHAEAALPRRVAAAAGPALADECKALGKLQLGQAVLTRGHRLPAKVVLHTALPRFDPAYRAACGAALGESLNACLRLFVAHRPQLKSIAIPVLHADEQNFPEEWACRVTLKALRSWMAAQPDPLPTVVLCCQRAEQVRPPPPLPRPPPSGSLLADRSRSSGQALLCPP